MKSSLLGSIIHENYEGIFGRVSEIPSEEDEENDKGNFLLGDDYGEFVHEDFDKITGMSYQNYLRFYDDML